ncbi:twin-arginine translocation signal domain-containing protein [Pannonibacter sp. SL95]|nr:twin-arginine translocation signal domain-containing protein [Pannonibacter sp. SL95]MCY1704659.1 twin-arginine translocation signal domain-containing protein [Pannonibacter sp. SL95]
MKTTRRQFLAGTAAVGVAGAIGAPNLFSQAFAQASNTLVFAAAGTVTGSWTRARTRSRRRSRRKASCSAG